MRQHGRLPGRLTASLDVIGRATQHAGARGPPLILLMNDEPTHRIVLIGMMGSGKSTVGALLAARRGWRYVDNDDDVRRLTAQEPADVISSGGEAELHAAEAAAFLRALDDPDPLVIAAAAAVVMDATCAAALRSQALVVYLRARPGTLRHRIGSGAGRRQDATDLDWLAARERERDAVYRGLATLTVDVDDLSPEQVVDHILEGLETPAGT